MSEALSREVTEAAWAIVKDARGMNETGHAAAVRWARAALELDDRETFTRRVRVTGHTHGYALVDAAWVCAQDFYAQGDAPQTGCGDIWTGA